MRYLAHFYLDVYLGIDESMIGINENDTLYAFLFDQDIWMKGQRLHGGNGSKKVKIGSPILHRLNGSDALLDANHCCRNLPFRGRARQDSRVRLPKEENARSRHQRLFVENVGKTEGNRS